MAFQLSSLIADWAKVASAPWLSVKILSILMSENESMFASVGNTDDSKFIGGLLTMFNCIDVRTMNKSGLVIYNHMISKNIKCGTLVH